MNPTLHLVGLLDLLGYSGLVEEFHHNPAIVRGVELVFADALQMMEGFKFASVGEHSAKWNMIARTITTRLISDTALITMPFFEIPQLSDDQNARDNFAVWMGSFLYCVCMFCLLIAGRTGYFFRGAIVLGQHYESNPHNERNLFMFSQALVEADKLIKKEKRRGTPRILVSKSLLQFLERQGPGNPLKEDGWVFEEDSYMVLNLYAVLFFWY